MYNIYDYVIVLVYYIYILHERLRGCIHIRDRNKVFADRSDTDGIISKQYKLAYGKNCLDFFILQCS